MSRTWFMSRALPALAALALLGCEAEMITDGSGGGNGTLTLLVVSGNNQTGTVGEQLPLPLVVKVVNAANKPVKGQIVNFRVTAGGGSVFAGAALTNAQGLAQELWTLGTVAGPQTVQARAVDGATGAPLVFATFNATAVAGAPAVVSVTPSSIGLAPGETVPLSATAADQYGNSIGSATYVWSSGNSGIVTVDQTGVVTGVGAGQTTISAQLGNLSASAVAVVDPSWSLKHLVSGPSFYDVWGTSATNVWAVGFAGLLSHFDGQNWVQWQGVTTANLYATWGASASDMWVVGLGGTLLHFNGSSWSSVPGLSSSPLHHVWGTSASNIWAGGWGDFWRFDGTSWSIVANPTGGEIHHFWGTSASDVWAVGGPGGAVHFDGSLWTAFSMPTSSRIFAVWGASSNDVWAVGEFGALMHYDGNSWSAVSSGTSRHLYGIWGAAWNDIWIAGDLGELIHFDGTSWTRDTAVSEADIWFHGIWSAGDGVWWAAGGDATRGLQGKILRGFR